MPKHSAILPAYPSRSIHGNHSEMTKFCGPKDTGYRSVSNQIWMWVDLLQRETDNQGRAEPRKQSPELENQSCSEKRFDTTEDDFGKVQHFGSVNSGGAPVFQGSQRAGRDFNVIYDRR